MNILIILAGALFIVLVFSWKCPERKDFFNALILAFTLLALVWTTQITSRIAADNEKASIKPVILRSNMISDWKDFCTNASSTNPFVFRVYKNHAIDIEGKIICENVEYPFFLAIGSFLDINNKGNATYDPKDFTLKMGWIEPDAALVAYPDRSNGERINKNNQLKLKYKDIKGTQYCLVEDSEVFLQTINECD